MTHRERAESFLRSIGISEGQKGPAGDAFSVLVLALEGQLAIAADEAAKPLRDLLVVVVRRVEVQRRLVASDRLKMQEESDGR